MEDLAESVLRQLDADKQPSRFELRSRTPVGWGVRDQFPHCEVLRVTAPVERGRRVFVVEFRADLMQLGSSVTYTEAPSVATFDHVDGAAAFVDGFVRNLGITETISLHENSRGAPRLAPVLAQWGFKVFDQPAHASVIRGAMMALVAR